MLVENGQLKLSKRPTLEELQPLYEQTFINRSSWRLRAPILTEITNFFGPDREPKDIFRVDVSTYKAWLEEKKNYAPATTRMHIATGSGWYLWMQVNGIVLDNPFYRFRQMIKYQYIGDQPK